jgi:nucleotide-binding universal stress UspA family protein
LTIALLIALAYVVQIQSAAWYVRLVDVIFGKTTTEPGTRQDAAAAGTSLKKAAIRTPPPLEAPPLVPAMQRILLATDLSPSARYAALHACSLGNQYQAEVTVMHVIPDMIDLLSSEAGVDLADFIHKSEWKDYHKKGIEKARQLMTRRIRETSRKVVEEIPHCPLSEDNIRVGIGNPAMEIVTAAREGDYDLIIMGSHGHGKLEETMIGSVTQEVIRQSSIPVLVVRLPPAYGFKAQPVEDVQLEEAPLTH